MEVIFQSAHQKKYSLKINFFLLASFRSVSSSDNLLKCATENNTNIALKPLNRNVNVTPNGKQKKRLKAAVSPKSSYYSDLLEWLLTLTIMNYCYYISRNESTSYYMAIIYIFIANFVVARTLYLRSFRVPDSYLNSIILENEKNLKNIENSQTERNIPPISEICSKGK